MADFEGKFHGVFVDDEDLVRTGRAWMEVTSGNGEFSVPLSDEQVAFREESARTAEKISADRKAVEATHGEVMQARDEVRPLVERASAAATQIEKSSTQVADAARGAAASRDEARGYADAARGSKEAAAGSASTAQQQVGVAKGHADAAKKSADAADASKRAAAQSAESIAGVEATVQGKHDAVMGLVSEAEGHANTAKGEAERAGRVVDEGVKSIEGHVSTAGDRAEAARSAATDANDAAVRAQNAAATAETGIREGQVQRAFLAPEVISEIEGKAAADHKHTLADVTDAPNAHASADTASTLMSRDGAGRARVKNPAAGLDIANKQYVDSAVGAKADKDHRHALEDIDGLRDHLWDELQGAVQQMTRDVTAQLDDKLNISEVSVGATGGVVVRRDSAGHVRLPEGAPNVGTAATSKKYVDDQLASKADVVALASKADVGHKHSMGDIEGMTDLIRGKAPVSHTHTSSAISDATWDAGKASAAGKLIKGSDNDGAIFYYRDPQTSLEVTRKSYVDRVVNARPALWVWDGNGTWSAPAAASSVDYVLNTKTSEIFNVRST